MTPRQVPLTVGKRPARSPSLIGRLTKIVLGLALLALLVWVAWPSSPMVPGPGRFGANGPVPVGMGDVVKSDFPVVIDALGTVTPLATVTVHTQIAGQLLEVGFKEGQKVNKGDFLAQIDPRPYQATLEQAEGSLKRDSALLAEAKLDLARYRKLLAQDSIASQQVDTQDSLVHQYEGAVIIDQGQIDAAKTNLIYCRITAPVSGRVGLRQVDPGNIAQPTDANGIVIITETQPITVVFTVAEDEVPRVARQLHAGLQLPVSAYDRNDSSKLATGSLATMDNQIDTTTGTLKLKADFANADEALFPNQFVNIRLEVEVLKDATVAPVAAIQRGAPGTYVYLLNAGDNPTVAVRPVKIGPTVAEKIVINSGLNPGDKVVVDGADRLRDGAAIKIPTAAPAGAPDATKPPEADSGQTRHHRGEGQGTDPSKPKPEGQTGKSDPAKSAQ
jgi:multidrug efflux system membrane fusion protein